MRPTGYQRAVVSGLACDAYTAGLIDKPMNDRINRELGGMERAAVEELRLILHDALSAGQKQE